MTTRIRKAWRATTTWSDTPIWQRDVVYASTAGKARYDFLLLISDPYPDATFKDIIVKRDAASDLALPAEHRIVPELSKQEREIVLHAFGASNRRSPGYRNHYCTDPADARLHRLAWELGLFRGPYGERDYGDTPGWVGAFYYLTDFGKNVALSMIPTYPREAAA